ncbi:BRCT domain-containing protein [Roseovarius confluentis]|uniref:BRCT domain-containing protein n=1 Tax=Roseovarius confluentis TaxID=1852027 RepID=UPI0011AEE32E|nr:BRCT domain-containing protein [Roseovarius confluentis]
MSKLEHGGHELEQIHSKNNDIKLFCHFTGFLEGIAASGYIERGEVEPLIAECVEFVEKYADCDASDLVQDFEADLMEHDTIVDAARFRIEQIDRSCNKSALNRFLGFCRGIVCDGVITVEEAKMLRDAIASQPELREVVGVNQIETSVQDALADGIVTAEESLELCTVIGSVVGDSYGDTGLAQTSGVANFDEFRLDDISVDLNEKMLVLTGNFKATPRKDFEDELEALGAFVARSVSGRTDFIIVGGEASRDWIEMNRGTKIRKAQELYAKSSRPNFVSEGQILRLMGKTQ